jgi:hypothetical protein
VKFGKGTYLFWAILDYIMNTSMAGGCRLEYENFKAAHELTRWLFKQAGKK